MFNDTRRRCAATFTACMLLLSLPLLTGDVMADVTPVEQEADFEPERIRAFWDSQVQEGSFVSAHEQLTLRYAYVRHPEAQTAIVISSGRTEGYVKYKELVQDLFSAGYSVYIHDHRGQGLSDRIVPERPHMGHVTAFAHYVDDLRRFVEEVVVPAGHQQHLLVAHSMGGGIASAYLQKHADDPVFAAVAMSSPMHGIPGDGFVMQTALRVLGWLGFDRRYLPVVGGDYNPETARTVQRDDCCTHSQPRKTFTFEEFERHPAARLGGPSVGWIRRAIAATRALREEAARVSVPVLILSGGADEVVSNDAQQAFCDNMNRGAARCVRTVIDGALHEHFIESDHWRDQAMDLLLGFLREHAP